MSEKRKDKYTLEQLREMSDEELIEISKASKPDGTATSDAYHAMQVRNERSGMWQKYGDHFSTKHYKDENVRNKRRNIW